MMDSYPTLRRTASLWIGLGFVLATLIGITGVFVLISEPLAGILIIASGFVIVLFFQTISQVILLLIDIADSLAARRASTQGAPQLNRKPKE